MKTECKILLSLFFSLVTSIILDAQTQATGTSPVYQFEVSSRKNYDYLYIDETIGNYYALVIGVNNYFDKNIQQLDNPIADAGELIETLKNHYQFGDSSILFLKNPVRVELMQAFEQLMAKMRPIDNLLIFYAGHGYWDKETKQGYWLLSDAIQKDRSTWFLNESILRFSEKIDARHVLLITDACFSGGIFKTRAVEDIEFEAVNKLYKFASRKAMTSGALTTVPDQSIFARTLISRLKQNKSLYLSAERLFLSLKGEVVSRGKADQIPQFGEITVDRNKGGDFIFMRKN